MKKIFLLLLPLLMQACSDESEGPWIRGGAVQLSVWDEQGNDLLNPKLKFSKSVDLSKIRLYYMVDGKEKLMYDSISDVPNGFYLISPEGNDTRGYRLYIGLNTVSKENPTITILQWENGQRDVIKTEFYRTRTVTDERKIWLNNLLVWDFNKKNHSVERHIKIKR